MDEELRLVVPIREPRLPSSCRSLQMGIMLRSAAFYAAAFALILLIPSASGRLMAVDFGSENIRVSLVNSNRRPIQVRAALPGATQGGGGGGCDCLSRR